MEYVIKSDLPKEELEALCRQKDPEAKVLQDGRDIGGLLFWSRKDLDSSLEEYAENQEEEGGSIDPKEVSKSVSDDELLAFFDDFKDSICERVGDVLYSDFIPGVVDRYEDKAKAEQDLQRQPSEPAISRGRS